MRPLIEVPLQCTHKRRYNTYERAVAMAVHRTEQDGSLQALMPYKCDLCGGYHLTKKVTGRAAERFPAVTK